MNLAAQLPGWEMVLFISLVVVFLIVGAVVVFVLLSRARWPMSYVVLEDVAGKGFSISRRGKCRAVGFGDGGEEIILLKHLNKYKIGYGKRIGPKQIGFGVGEDGLWYQFSFGDLNKTLREIGVMPTSVNVRLGMASVRKGLDKRLEPKDFMEKYGVLIGMGFLFFMMLVAAGMIWYSQEQQLKIANTNSAAINASFATQEATQKTLATLDNILSKVNVQSQGVSNGVNASIGGSGLIPIG